MVGIADGYNPAVGAGNGTWIRAVQPVEPDVISHAVLSRTCVAELVDRVGPGPIGWAVEVAGGMAQSILAVIPELGVDGFVQEMRKGCEVVAVQTVAALAREKFDLDAVLSPEVFAGPAEAVIRGVGIEHILRSIQVAHTYAHHQFVEAASDSLPPEERFAALRLISERLFAITDLLSSRMAAEFSRVQAAWLTTSAAVRMELVDEILSGAEVSSERATRVLEYDLTRRHTALVVWVADAAQAGPGVLELTATQVLRASGHSAALVLPIGQRRVWAWGSTVRGNAPAPSIGSYEPTAGVQVAAGLPGAGVSGFRASHGQALEAARVGMASKQPRRVWDYGDVDMLTMLTHRDDVARQFVRRELGDLAAPGEATGVLRATLKCYLDNERSLNAAAGALHVARNTVAYRVGRAEALRGRAVGDRRMQLQAALALVEEFGDEFAVSHPEP
ncbi:PucR family transcriptional regulator [Flexivirga meconopsidis]|uniref:PucR family transcriptional regulator n=1 Tax=Flexivirga meconopsidis TaxID=2977121 RepID=UPI00223EDB51|nr:helix-turn-helix domain-containing protein [Flexivirga meconopsidis]